MKEFRNISTHRGEPGVRSPQQLERAAWKEFKVGSGESKHWDSHRQKHSYRICVILTFYFFVCNYWITVTALDHPVIVTRASQIRVKKCSLHQDTETRKKTVPSPKDGLMDKFKSISHLYCPRWSFYQGSLPRCPPYSVPSLSHFSLKSDETWTLVLCCAGHFTSVMQTTWN